MRLVETVRMDFRLTEMNIPITIVIYTWLDGFQTATNYLFEVTRQVRPPKHIDIG